jgi:hypothetical protein
MSEQIQARSSGHKSSEKYDNDGLLKDMINISLAELNIGDKERNNTELEVRFGTKGIKRIDKIDFDNVIKKLKSIGFKIEQDTYLMRAYPEFIDPITGINKISSVRLEIEGLSMIQTYCKTNSLTDIQYASNFVQKGF